MSRLTWRYVLTREDTSGEEFWSIRELYEGPKKGMISWTLNEISAGGDSPEAVAMDLRRMLEATGRPFLDLTLNPPRLVDAEAS